MSKIVPQTCEILWNVLQPDVMPLPDERKWKHIAEEFEELWQFPHCLGSLDGKHIMIQAPKNSGSLFFNYKKHFSVVLLAVVDANYKFVIVDIGAYGRQSDGSVFANSLFGRMLKAQQLPIPPPEPLGGSASPDLPYVFVGDEAFPLLQNLMRPYPGGNLTREKIIFNYRLSRARRTVENAFGILASRFRCFHRPLMLTTKHVAAVVKAAVVIHNFLRGEVGSQYTEIASEIQSCNNQATLLTSMRRVGRSYSSTASNVREAFSRYFCLPEGSISWQDNLTQRVD